LKSLFQPFYTILLDIRWFLWVVEIAILLVAWWNKILGMMFKKGTIGICKT
jgi:hypothetical protein